MLDRAIRCSCANPHDEFVLSCFAVLLLLTPLPETLNRGAYAPTRPLCACGSWGFWGLRFRWIGFTTPRT